MYAKLDVVNYIIAQVGAAPVADLNDLLPDVQSALLRLDEASRSLQKRGWWFNKEFNIVLPKATDDTIPIPADASKILRASPCFLIIRDGEAYDPYARSNLFPEVDNITVDLVYFHQWEWLPVEAQDFIKETAAASHVRIELEDERKALGIERIARQHYVELQKCELKMRKYNVGRSAAFISTRGRVRPYGRTGSNNPNIPGG